MYRYMYMYMYGERGKGGAELSSRPLVEIFIVCGSFPVIYNY